MNHLIAFSLYLAINVEGIHNCRCPLKRGVVSVRVSISGADIGMAENAPYFSKRKMPLH